MATELAKAYVQIVPSAVGIKNSLTNVLGGEGTAAGASVGSKLAGAIKGAIATAGIGVALKAALTEGAALEQSIGGIETLFGAGGKTLAEYAQSVNKTVSEAKGEYETLMQSQQMVIDNAANAYKTAGLSANQYMELTTSFAASLLQSTAGDTQRAAQVADMAMTDMSDNANKMGTSMESITDAYKGFAKQNYTMLDNLKLGYGGTKTEMERLLSDAEKLTGVEYDISSLDDVYEAIHAIQDDLGITGTTAQEAASTLSGSFASMKSAASNVLANLTLGRDLGPSLQGLAETLSTFLVGNLLPALWNILRSLPGALVTFIQALIPQLVTAMMGFVPQLGMGITAALPQLLAAAHQVITNFATGLVEAIPQLLQTGQEILSGIITGFTTAMPMIFDTLLAFFTTLTTGIIANLPMLIESGKTLLLNLINGFTASFPQMIVSAGRAVATMVQGIAQNLPQIIRSGVDLIVSLVSGLLSALPKIGAAMKEAADLIWDALADVDWMELGGDIVRGIVNGIGALAGLLWDAAVNLAKTALDAIKDFLQIGSPSKRMGDEVGHWIPPGVAGGVRRNAAPLLDEMDNLARQTVSAFQPRLSLQLADGGAMRGSMLRDSAPSTVYSPTLQQTIYTHDSLSAAEMSREGERMLERSRWKLQ